MCVCVCVRARARARLLFMRFSYKHVLFPCTASIDLVFINDSDSGFCAVLTASLTTIQVNFAFNELKECYFLLFHHIYVLCLAESYFVAF